MEGYVPDYLCYHDNNWPGKDNVSVNMETWAPMKVGLTLDQRRDDSTDVEPTLHQPTLLSGNLWSFCFKTALVGCFIGPEEMW